MWLIEKKLPVVIYHNHKCLFRPVCKLIPLPIHEVFTYPNAYQHYTWQMVS
jgi:hypothetical protein